MLAIPDISPIGWILIVWFACALLLHGEASQRSSRYLAADIGE